MSLPTERYLENISNQVMELDPSIVQQVDDQRHYIDEQGTRRFGNRLRR
jgi:hypothetical protein